MKKSYILAILFCCMLGVTGCGEKTTQPEQTVTDSVETENPTENVAEENVETESVAEVIEEPTGKEFLKAIELDKPAFVVVDKESGACTILENGQEWQLSATEGLYLYENGEWTRNWDGAVCIPEELKYEDYQGFTLHILTITGEREAYVIEFANSAQDRYILVCTLTTEAPILEGAYYQDDIVEMLLDYHKPVAEYITSPNAFPCTEEEIKDVCEKNALHISWLARAYKKYYCNILQTDESKIQEWTDILGTYYMAELEDVKNYGYTIEKYLKDCGKESVEEYISQYLAWAPDYAAQEYVYDKILEQEGLTYSEEWIAEFEADDGFFSAQFGCDDETYNKLKVFELKEYKVGKLIYESLVE